MSGTLSSEALVVCFSLVEDAEPLISTLSVNQVLNPWKWVPILYRLFIKEVVIYTLVQ